MSRTRLLAQTSGQSPDIDNVQLSFPLNHKTYLRTPNPRKSTAPPDPPTPPHHVPPTPHPHPLHLRPRPHNQHPNPAPQHPLTLRHQSGHPCNTDARIPASASFDVDGPPRCHETLAGVSRHFWRQCVPGGCGPGGVHGGWWGGRIFVADARDGGRLMGWRGGGGLRGREEEEEELQAYCHCKGVRFKITQPDESSAQMTAPRDDIVGHPLDRSKTRR